MTAKLIRIRDLAAVVRSKNSGPFELTLDVFFTSEENFRLAQNSGAITAERLAALYHVSPADVLGLTWFAPASALKITLKRWVPSAALGDTDVFGAQQHAPLLDLELPCP
jgi:hypothetical protein